jgi:carboxyl-terminal processing protease
VDLLSQLGQSHFAIIPREAFAPGASMGKGQPGFDVRVLEKRVVVTRGNARIRPGWQVVSVRNQPALPSGVERLPAIVQYRIVLDRLRGEPGESIHVLLLDAADRTLETEITLSGPEREAAGVGMLPAQALEIETREIDGCGYLRFNWFLDPVQLVPAVQNAVERFSAVPGMVLDLRGNPGGMGLLAPGIAGFYFRNQGLRLGTMRMRDASLEFVINPRLPYYNQRLAILIDETSASTAEILAAGMRDLKRATLFGTRTAGAALPSWIERLPNGDGFQYAAGDYISASGKRLEGVGVMPDIEVAHTRDLLLGGTDAALKAASDWLRQGTH